MRQHFPVILLAFCSVMHEAAAAPIRLVTGDDFPPYTGKQLPGGGMLTEIVQRTFQVAGMETTLEWAPWKRGYELAKIGEFDATFPYARKPEREKEYLYSDLIFGGMRSVYARPNSGIDPANLESFRGRNYCVPTGFLVYPQMEALLKDGGIKMQHAVSLATCAKLLALGRVDFYITDSVAGDAALQQAAVGSMAERLAKPFDRAEFYLIVPKNHATAQALITQFNAALKTLKAKGEYAEIVERHPK